MMHGLSPPLALPVLTFVWVFVGVGMLLCSAGITEELGKDNADTLMCQRVLLLFSHLLAIPNPTGSTLNLKVAQGHLQEDFIMTLAEAEVLQVFLTFSSFSSFTPVRVPRIHQPCRALLVLPLPLRSALRVSPYAHVSCAPSPWATHPEHPTSPPPHQFFLWMMLDIWYNILRTFNASDLSRAARTMDDEAKREAKATERMARAMADAQRLGLGSRRARAMVQQAREEVAADAHARSHDPLSSLRKREAGVKRYGCGVVWCMVYLGCMRVCHAVRVMSCVSCVCVLRVRDCNNVTVCDAGAGAGGVAIMTDCIVRRYPLAIHGFVAPTPWPTPCNPRN